MIGTTFHMGVTERPFRINLSSRHRAYLGPLRTGLVALSLVLVGGVAWSLYDVLMIHGAAGQVQLALERVREQDRLLMAQAGKEGLDLSDAAWQRLAGEVAFANQLIAARSFSWTQFLSGLEEVVPARLAIDSIRFDSKGSIIKLTGVAMSLEDVTAFTLVLQDHRTFNDPVLVQHRGVENGMVGFELTVRYRGSGR